MSQIQTLTESLATDVQALAATLGTCPTIYLTLLPDGSIDARAESSSPDDVMTFPSPDMTPDWLAQHLRHSPREGVRSLLVRRARILGGGRTDVHLVVRYEGTRWVMHDGDRARTVVDVPVSFGGSAADAELGTVARIAWELAECPAEGLVTVVPLAARGRVSYDLDDYALGAAEMVDPPVTWYRALRVEDSLRDVESEDPIVLRMMRAQTARLRAESRQRAARAALAQYIWDDTWTSDGEIAAWVRDGSGTDPTTPGPGLGEDVMATIAALEVGGVGGPGGYSGDATARMSWAGGLGSGRRQAHDGEAWTAAIRSLASEHLEPAAVIAALPYIRPTDLEWPMAYALRQIAGFLHSPSHTTAWCSVAREVYRRATDVLMPVDLRVEPLGHRYDVHMPAPELPAAVVEAS